jgi:cytoskeleton protein RodZ
MSETGAALEPGAASGSAGALLREAREVRGMPIEELAATLKVVPRKIEMLEADRFDEFPDPVFVRALAQSVCRCLKVDAAPVLALLPQTPSQRLEQVHVGLNAPFRDRPAQMIPDDWSGVAKPVIWAPALLVVAAAVVYFFPVDVLSPPKVSPRAAAIAPAASGSEAALGSMVSASAAAGNEVALVTAAPAQAPVSVPPSVALTVPLGTGSGSSTAVINPGSASPASSDQAAVKPSTAGPAPVSAAPAPTEVPPVAEKPGASTEKVPASPSGVLQFRTAADSWIEVQDGRGQMLLSRKLESGEAVGLNGAMPMKVTIGNVRATQVTFRGKPMDLALFTRDNIARVELK